MARYQMLTNVRYDGRKFLKGEECPKEFAAIMVDKGLAFEVKEDAPPSPKPDYKPKKKKGA